MPRILRWTAVTLVGVMAVTVAFTAGFDTGRRAPDLLAAQGDWGLRVVDWVHARLDGASPQDSAAGKTQPDPTVPDDSDDFQLFWEVYDLVESQAYGSLPEPTDLTYGVIRGSLRALDDPFTVFTDPVVTEVQRPELNSSFEGIGAYVATNEAGQLVIQTPMRGQPAERAGIMAGDIVLKVDDRDIAGLDVEDAVLLIRGPKGTTVRLTILRRGYAAPLEIAVVRDRIDIPSVNQVRTLDDLGAPDVGYIELTMFAADTTAELRSAVAELRQKGAKALVLDLRDNPGGFLDTAIGVASEFLDNVVIAYQEDKSGRRIAERAKRGGRALDLPLVVLVNHGSASAAEIVAGAIQDHRRGTLVGVTTFGKGSVQNVHDLADRSQVRVTIAAWLTPRGRMIHRRGVEPDVPVPLTSDDVAAERDPQLERAILEARALMESK